MDDLVQVLIFVATAIFFIFSAVKKSKKKSGNKSVTFESVVESFLGEPVKKAQELEVEPDTEFTQHQAWFEQEHDEVSVVEPSKSTKSSFEEEGVDAIPDKKSTSNLAYEIEEEEAELEFDLREAVIYSEILNRKTY